MGQALLPLSAEELLDDGVASDRASGPVSDCYGPARSSMRLWAPPVRPVFLAASLRVRRRAGNTIPRIARASLNFLVAGSDLCLTLRQAVFCICIVFNKTGLMLGPGRGRNREPRGPELLPRVVLVSVLAYQLGQPWGRPRVVHLKPATIF